MAVATGMKKIKLNGVGMENSRTFTAIDVGTTKVFSVIGQKLDDGRIEVLGYGSAPCSGLRKGVVNDVPVTKRAIRASLDAAEAGSGVKVESAFVGISGAGVAYENRVDTIDWVGEHGVITANELERVPKSVARNGMRSRDLNRKVIHSIPQKFTIDGNRGVARPLGMHANKLDVESHLVAALETDLGNLTAAVEGAGVKVESFVLEALASSEAALSESERVRGAALIDIGGGTTDVIVYKGGTIKYSSVIPIGGFQFTNDICLVYNTTYEAAEAAKLKHACVRLDSNRVHEEVELPIDGKDLPLKASLHEICQLTRERAIELLRLIVIKLREAGVDDLAGYPLVFAGGASGLDGMLDLFKVSTGADVRFGAPLGYMGVPEELQSPAYSTGVGVMLWASYQYDNDAPHRAIRRNGHRKNGVKEAEAKKRKRGILSLFSR